MEFHELFRAHLAKSGLTQAAFAAVTQDHDSNVNSVVRGKRPPPLHRLARWADVLKLAGDERQEFLQAGVRKHMPKELGVLHLSDLKPGEYRAVEVARLPPHVQARVRTFSAIEERRVSDDQLRAALREQIEIRHAQAIHLKHAEARAEQAESDLAALRDQLAALASASAHPALPTMGESAARPSDPDARPNPTTLGEAIDPLRQGTRPDVDVDDATQARINANLAAAEVILDHEQGIRPTLQQQREAPRRPTPKPRVRH
jgi:transcriptional regulator with XRE-family HTH domain